MAKRATTRLEIYNSAFYMRFDLSCILGEIVVGLNWKHFQNFLRLFEYLVVENEL